MKVSPWAAAHSLSNDTVSTLVADQFSVLRPARVTGRYEGWDNEAFEINNQWIFRFPKRAEGELLLRREIALLPRLSKTLPLPVPEYSFIGTPGPAYPYAFAGYEKLNGIPAIELSTPQSETIPLAGLLGCFLSSVHSFPALDAQKLGIVQAEVDPGVAIAEALAELCELASTLPSDISSRCARYLENHLRANMHYSCPRRLLHGDFSAEHILLSSDGRTVIGVIDWTDAEFGDPAFDFGYLWVWRGDPLVGEVLQHYQGDVDGEFLDRVRVYGVCSAVADYHYGIMAGIDKNRQIGLAALERSFLVRD